MSTTDQAPRQGGTQPPKRRLWLIALAMLGGALITAGIAALLITVFQHKQEGTVRPVRVVEMTDETYDPATWGLNFPLEYETWKKTSEIDPANAVPQTPTAEDPRTSKTHSKLEADPRLVTMWQGYAFSVEYNEPRGHDFMLADQRYVKRVTQFKQPGACLNCHASTYPIMKQLGNGDINAGFDAMNKMPYADATKLAEHPVSCIDCHDAETMALRITRPGFINGIAELKAGQGVADYDVNRDATAAEKRTFVCAQCHVEYYFKGDAKTLTFPWDKGLTVDNALEYYDEIGWSDFTHKLTNAPVVKAQHPDYETWSQGIHARNGVTCADCHMPYTKSGATKFTDHQVRSPMSTTEQINTACLTCHRATEDEMKARVTAIQSTYHDGVDVSFDALDALIKELQTAATDGTPADRIAIAQSYQRRAQFLLDYSVSENSQGFHAPQYSMSILNDVTDAAQKGRLALKGTQLPMSSTPAPHPPK